ncbi:hypothetical protein B1218_37610, partial [Pseudomonas ogarae]
AGADVSVVLKRLTAETASGADQDDGAAIQHFQLVIGDGAAMSQTQKQTGGLRKWLGVGVDL